LVIVPVEVSAPSEAKVGQESGPASPVLMIAKRIGKEEFRRSRRTPNVVTPRRREAMLR
jgi:hypothetical protein